MDIAYIQQKDLPLHLYSNKSNSIIIDNSIIKRKRDNYDIEDNSVKVDRQHIE